MGFLFIVVVALLVGFSEAAEGTEERQGKIVCRILSCSATARCTDVSTVTKDHTSCKFRSVEAVGTVV